MYQTIMTQTTLSCRDPIEQGKEPMKFIQRTFCLIVLALALSLPVLAAAPTSPAKKRAPAVRPMPTSPESLDGRYADEPGRAVYQVLLGEIALKRGDLSLAIKAYSDLALRTRDQIGRAHV